MAKQYLDKDRFPNSDSLYICSQTFDKGGEYDPLLEAFFLMAKEARHKVERFSYYQVFAQDQLSQIQTEELSIEARIKAAENCIA